MEYLNSIRAALKATAPVVAIPLEGHAPICIRRKLLAGVLKGVTIDAVQASTSYYTDFPHACVIITGHVRNLAATMSGAERRDSRR